MEYLKKGGRIPKTVAAFGEMLSIKPVVSLEQGEVVILGKAPRLQKRKQSPDEAHPRGGRH